MKKRLITSALPYVNNIPHLGNLLQVLSADAFARFCRQYGYDTLYICGTDEYGTATENRALEEGLSPRELCDHYHAIHADIYRWFGIKFDHFGRTSRPIQTEIVQNIFRKIEDRGYIKKSTIEQLYCEKDQRFLADRYVQGCCPYCHNEEARGDQCENCGKLLDPVDLKNPRCGRCGEKPVFRETKHLYLDLPRIKPELEIWIEEAKKTGFWTKNALKMTESWIRDGLKERAITRDLKWGIPVPKEGYEDKVFYVWFDAPIGYVSITADLTPDWEKWWRRPQDTELFQFIGKDNIPFHTVIFPATQIASGENWTKLHHMSSTEYLNYEEGKFSKSKGVGVFGTDCQETGIPADLWRFYLFYNRPEKADYRFLWSDFQETINSELIGNFANLVNRTLSFLCQFYEARVPQASLDEELWERIKVREKIITEKLNRAELRSAFHDIFALADLGNKAFQSGEPWVSRKKAPEKAATLIKTLIFLLRDLGILIKPYLPSTSERICAWLHTDRDNWDLLGSLQGPTVIATPERLFDKIEDEQIVALKKRFSGQQKNQKKEDKPPKDENKNVSSLTAEENFASLDLRAALITAVEEHPQADKLYVIFLNDGSQEVRQICSGLVENYQREELQGKTIILVHNLKKARFRGVESRGMLLAAEDSEKNLEVLTVQAKPGERVYLEGSSPSAVVTKQISIKHFFKTVIRVENGTIKVGESPLCIAGKPLKTSIIQRGTVG